MAHNPSRSAYGSLVERLNRFPQGAPPSAALYRILKLLFTEREAELVASLPVLPFSAAAAAKRWHMEESEARPILDRLSSRCLLLDSENEAGQITYVLPPPMAGFFEFSMMRTRGDIDQPLLGQLFYQYLNEEEDFVKTLFAPTGTELGRVFVQEAALPPETQSLYAGDPFDIPEPERGIYILDYERASEVIQTATHRGIGMCYCRHKMQHVDQACAAPMDICLTFNGVAEPLIRHGYARAVGVAEGLDLLQQAWENNLVQCGENARQKVSFICNCCGCCCEALVAARRFAFLTPVATTNFIASVDPDTCNGCGKCIDACPVEAMSLVSAKDPHKPKRRKAHLIEETCLGCGVCVRACPTSALSLKSRAQRVITPVTSAHRVVSMAIERGALTQLIFDNNALASHRLMAAILGVILRLPPAHQAIASRQFKSRYMERLLTWNESRVAPNPSAPGKKPGEQ